MTLPMAMLCVSQGISEVCRVNAQPREESLGAPLTSIAYGKDMQIPSSFLFGSKEKHRSLKQVRFEWAHM